MVERFLAGSSTRLLLAVLFAPVGAWVGGVSVVYGYTVMMIGEMPPHRPVLDALFGPLFTIMFLPLAAVPIMLIGSVIHLLLSTLGIRGWAPYVIAGVATGLALGYPQFECPSELQGMACARLLLIDLFAFAAMPGLGAALTFWMILRPDRAAGR